MVCYNGNINEVQHTVLQCRNLVRLNVAAA